MEKVLTGISLIMALMATSSAQAQDSLANASKASADSAVALGEMTEAGVKVVGGAVALPIAAVGIVAEGAGKALHQGGKAMWESANGPLEITPQTLTAQPTPQVPYDRAPRPTQPASPAKAAG
jgi:hypothetical protein